MVTTKPGGFGVFFFFHFSDLWRPQFDYHATCDATVGGFGTPFVGVPPAKNLPMRFRVDFFRIRPGNMQFSKIDSKNVGATARAKLD